MRRRGIENLMNLASKFSRPPRAPAGAKETGAAAGMDAAAGPAGTAPAPEGGLTVAQALRGVAMARAALDQLEATSSHPARKLIARAGRRALAEAKRILRRQQ